MHHSCSLFIAAEERPPASLSVPSGFAYDACNAALEAAVEECYVLLWPAVCVAVTASGAALPSTMAELAARAAAARPRAQKVRLTEPRVNSMELTVMLFSSRKQSRRRPPPYRPQLNNSNCLSCRNNSRRLPSLIPLLHKDDTHKSRMNNKEKTVSSRPHQPRSRLSLCCRATMRKQGRRAEIICS